MACTQLVVVEQPKKEEDFTINLRSPYDHPEVVKERIVGPVAIGLAQLAQLVFGK